MSAPSLHTSPRRPGQQAEFTFEVRPNPAPASDESRTQILRSPGFGTYFTDHMARVTWTTDRGWHDARVEPYGPLQLEPATAVLHYAQEIFEGLKAYRHADGSIWTFRPQSNAARFMRSARRLALPELPESLFIGSLDALVQADAAWVPSGGETSLYMRPFMFASEVFLGVRPSSVVEYLVIASPAGAYFSSGVQPVSIWLSQEYTRAAPGGTGAAKCGGNYAAGLLPQQEAAAHGCDQVVFLDATEHRWVEELGGMNLFFVQDDGTMLTPSLTGTILEGVTRQSVLQIAADLGHDVQERRVSVREWREGVESGRIVEVFACGTAAVITPVGELVEPGRRSVTPEGGEVGARIRQALLDIQYGRAEDRHGWMHRLA